MVFYSPALTRQGVNRVKCRIYYDHAIKLVLYERVPHVSQLWEGSEDVDLTVIGLEPTEYGHMSPGYFASTKMPA